MEDPVTDEVKNQGTVEGYRPTPYQDASWEIVGEVAEEDKEFKPLQIEVADVASYSVDPMFADFGGKPADGGLRRWHLSELAGKSVTRGQKKEEEVPGVIKITEVELTRRLEEAEKRGREKQLKESGEECNVQISEIEERVGNLYRDLSAQIKEHLEAIEREAAKLAVQISEKLISHAVEINPEYIVEIVREAIKQSGSAQLFKVRISPEDMEFVKVVNLEKRMKEYDGTWEFIADETIRAGCILETSAGEVDYRIDAAFERIRDNVLKVL